MYDSVSMLTFDWNLVPLIKFQCFVIFVVYDKIALGENKNGI